VSGAPAARLAAEKKILYASEQDPAARAVWRAEVAQLEPSRFVFVDETSTATNLTRRYARAPRAERAVGYVPRNYGTRTTLIAALTPAGIDAPMLLTGAVNTLAFTAYVEQVLCPTLRPGQVVIMDNLSSHLGAPIRALIEAAQCRLLLLPAYSPDFNPIELAFAKLKEALRAAAARTQAARDAAITEALDAISAADARGWFRHCGYLLPNST
jgi:transposase